LPIGAIGGEPEHAPVSRWTAGTAPMVLLSRIWNLVVGVSLTAMSAHVSSTLPALYELESEVMEEVWLQGHTNVRGVMEALNKKGKKDRAYTTYMSVMTRLVSKGLLGRKRDGKADTYWPALSREEFQRARAEQEVSALVDEFGEVALAHFAKEIEKLDPGRLKALRRLARGE
jgi:predicted transcriptional regulator